MTTEDRRRQREQFAALQRKALEDLGMSRKDVDEAMEPLLSFHLMCDETDARAAEVDRYVEERRDSIRQGGRRSKGRFRLEDQP